MGHQKNLLIVYGLKEIDISSFGEVYIYKLSSCKILSKYQFTILNDPERLDAISDIERDKFSSWVFKQGENYLYKNFQNLLNFDCFRFGDFSSMRNEIYPTYNLICNLLLIKEKLFEHNILSVKLIGFPINIEIIFKSYLQKQIYVLNKLNFHTLIFSKFRNFLILIRSLGSSLLFLLRLFCSFIYLKIYKFYDYDIKSRKNLNIFLTRFPLHFSESEVDEKYTSLFCENDVYLMDLISDGIHQSLSFKEYSVSINRLKKFKRNVVLLDNYINLYDFFKIALKVPFIITLYLLLLNKKYIYYGINISSLINYEQIYSMSKNIRLLSIAPKIDKISKLINFSKFYFTLFEFPYGKLISNFINRNKSCETIGVQHGPSTRRKLFHFVPNNLNNKFLNYKFIPKKVLCEDLYSFQIYSEAKYEHIEIMDTVFRLAYLNKIKKNKNANMKVIFGGLHDSNEILMELEDFLREKKEEFFFKPHPRSVLSKNSIKLIESLPNLSITNDHPNKILPKCNFVISTYSSIAIEAMNMSIDLGIVDIPGLVNLSPLADKEFILKNLSKSRIIFFSRSD